MLKGLEKGRGKYISFFLLPFLGTRLYCSMLVGEISQVRW